MYLKSLSVAGFKSFADRTRLEFGSGVNVIVGPNGTGKSNLVDAVAWVMGTQAASVMRTERMDEVIFAGTATRPSHGRAEVSLTFENSEGRLPLDLAEVTITRRLYRDGTSEYEVNGTPCRLLDIQDLLSDSGVGRHQHVIVGQGRIGSILSARPDEHRAVIEEAAGVTKHRSRRDRAIRRLELTEIDTARLRDILTEQQRRMRPLRRQARAAEQHDAVKAEARALRLWLGGEELRRLQTRHAAIEVERAGVNEQLAGFEREASGLESALGGLEAAAGTSGRALEADTAAAARLETSAERLQRIALVARERRMSLENRARGAGERRGDLEDERGHLEQVLATTATEENDAAERAERFEALLRELDDEERSLADQAQLPAEGVVASLRGDLRALEKATERDRSEARSIDARLAVVRAHLAEESHDEERVRANIQRIDEQTGPAEAAYDAVRSARVRDQEGWERAEEQAAAAGLDVAGARARVEALEAAAAGLFDPEARRAVEAHDAVIGRLVARLDVPAGLEAAVDAALGPWADGFVADPLQETVGDLKRAGFGGIALVSAAGTDAAPAVDVARSLGLEALIERLGPSTDAALAASLLGDVILVEGWTAGRDVVLRHGGIRAVTPEGDLITAFGVRTAIPDGAGQVAIEAAGAALERAETAVARAASLQTTTRRSFEQARALEREALEALEALETMLAGATEALAVLQRSRAQGVAEVERLEARTAAIDDASHARDERLTELRKSLAGFEGEEAARQVAWESINQRRIDVARRRDETQRHVQQAAGELATVAERRRITKRRVDDIEGQLERLDERPADPGRIGRLEQVEARARRAQDTVRDHIARLRERQRTLRSQAGEAGQRLEEARRRMRQIDHESLALKERAAESGVEEAETRVRLESVAEGLRRDADASEEEALAAPPQEVPADTDPQEHLEALVRKLRRMGPINPLAASEYHELEERAAFLETQIEDLDESRRDLRKVISALDEQISLLFQKSFDDIAACYEENFALLFPGGRGRLRLTEPENLLETGVEIEAQPLGKKVGRLALLSGGERSLAALAFLFGVFRARPSPFYILDEVEAALDDTNLRRFIRLIDTLRGSAQLAIVTHQQHTMEAADILYGVTMEPGASSKVIAKRLADVSA